MEGMFLGGKKGTRCWSTRTGWALGTLVRVSPWLCQASYAIQVDDHHLIRVQPAAAAAARNPSLNLI
jgi:hypothetical protein